MNDHDHTPQWWDNFWADPSQHFGAPREQLLDYVSNFRSQQPTLEAQCTLVDIGSGNGRYAIPFARRGFLTSVIEKSPEACAIIQRRCRDEGVFVALVNKDILDAPSDQYDVVFSSGLIEEIVPESQTAAVRKVQSLVKTGGLLVLKYCLEIAQRGKTVAENSVIPLFSPSDWDILETATDPEMRQSIATIDFENQVRTEMIIARKKSSR